MNSPKEQNLLEDRPRSIHNFCNFVIESARFKQIMSQQNQLRVSPFTVNIRPGLVNVRTGRYRQNSLILVLEFYVHSCPRFPPHSFHICWNVWAEQDDLFFYNFIATRLVDVCRIVPQKWPMHFDSK